MTAKKKWLLVPAAIAILLAGAYVYLSKLDPAQRPASTETVEITEERLARGKYLVEAVMTCLDCHSDRQSDRWGMPPFPDRLGSGGTRCWDESFGVPGTVCFPNITPDPETGLGNWTDGEIMRALREGVDRSGRAMIVMPAYRQLSDEDTRAVVAYLRKMKPIRAERPKTQLDALASVTIKRVTRPLSGPVAAVDPSDPIAYGRYLARLAGCENCHTPTDGRGQLIRDRAFSGGRKFKLAAGGPEITSTNLTPHAAGIGKLSKEAFTALFARPDTGAKIAPEKNTVMPWPSYSGLTAEDAGAIYTFLSSVPPLETGTSQ